MKNMFTWSIKRLPSIDLCSSSSLYPMHRARIQTRHLNLLRLPAINRSGSWSSIMHRASRQPQRSPRSPGGLCSAQAVQARPGLLCVCSLSKARQTAPWQNNSRSDRASQAGYLEAADCLPREPCRSYLSKTKVSSCNFTDGSNSLAGKRCGHSNQEWLGSFWCKWPFAAASCQVSARQYTARWKNQTAY